MKRTSAELKRMAREMLRGRYGIPMGAFVITILISCILTFPFAIVCNPVLTFSVVQIVIYFVAMLIIGMLTSCLSVGILRMHMQIARNLPFTLTDMFWAFSHNPQKFIGAGILLGLITFACFLPTFVFYGIAILLQNLVLLGIGAFLLIPECVAAIIITSRYALIMMLLVDEPQANVLAAFKESHKLMRGNLKRYIYIQFSFLGWTILGALSCYIGFLWIVPYMIQTNVNFYLELTGAFDMNMTIAKQPVTVSLEKPITDQNDEQI